MAFGMTQCHNVSLWHYLLDDRRLQNWKEKFTLTPNKRDKMMETSVSTSVLLPSPVPVVNKTGSANISSPALFIFKKLCCLNVSLIQIFNELQIYWTFPLSFPQCQWHCPLTLSVCVWCMHSSGFAHWLWHVNWLNCYANLHFGTSCLDFFTFESNFMDVPYKLYSEALAFNSWALLDFLVATFVCYEYNYDKATKSFWLCGKILVFDLLSAFFIPLIHNVVCHMMQIVQSVWPLVFNAQSAASAISGLFQTILVNNDIRHCWVV